MNVFSGQALKHRLSQLVIGGFILLSFWACPHPIAAGEWKQKG